VNATPTGRNLLVATIDVGRLNDYKSLAAALVGALVEHGIRYISAPREILDMLSKQNLDHVFEDEGIPDPLFLSQIPMVAVFSPSTTEIDTAWFLEGLRLESESTPAILVMRSDARISGDSRSLGDSRPVMSVAQFTTLLATM
jgi:hypothetical protein